MNKIKKVLNKYNLKPKKIEYRGKTVLIGTDTNKYVLKEIKNKSIYKYLNSRNFNYYPNHISDNTDDYEVVEFLEEIETPTEQKMIDLIETVSLLHYKTTYYKEIDESTYKEIYEDLNNNIDYLSGYYNDIISIIETRVFMSPSEYLLARNISLVFKLLIKNKMDLDKWYELAKKETKQRVVIIHNNLSLDHFIKNDSNYLISWDKSKIGMPIFDLYKLYNNHILDFDFEEILTKYESSYPLLEIEKKLLLILISIPKKLEFNNTEYVNTLYVNDEVTRLNKTINLSFFKEEVNETN